MKNEKKHIARKVIASATVLGAVSMGAVGLSGTAGASTTSSTISSSQRAALCAQARKAKIPPMASVNAFTKRADSYAAKAAKADAAAATAKAAGKTGREQRSERWATWLNKLANRNKRAASNLQKERSKAEARLSADVARVCSGS
jgi:hypothetical protein